MKVLDLCAGAGGLSLGFKQAGFEVDAVEIDHDACITHCTNVGPCIEASIWDHHPAQEYDGVVGGIPCQSYSAAGKRQGMDDRRGQLYKPFLRIAQEAKARFVLIENVKGLLSARATKRSQKGTAIKMIVKAIKKAGFPHIIQKVICAADHKVPQLRYRLFILGFQSKTDRDQFEWPEPTHADAALNTDLPPWITVRQALELGDGPYQSGRVDGASWNGMRMLDVDSPSTTVLSSETPEMLSPLEFANANYRAELAAALAVAGVLNRPSTTIDSKGNVSTAGHHKSNKHGAVRISVEQLAILQGFPKNFIFTGRTKASLHKQVGNAVPPPLAKAVATSLLAMLREPRDVE